MQYVYFDWNVFNKIEKIVAASATERETYTKLENLLREGRFLAPYSNAHINDLYRGYTKNPNYIEGHLNTLGRLTNNLCITQYWGEPQAKWHYRYPKEFFYTKIVEKDETPDSFLKLFGSFEDDPLIQAYWELQKTTLKLTPVDSAFKQVYSMDPIFNIIFPKTKTEMNMLALSEDLYHFAYKIKIDFALYKSFRKFLNQLRVKLPQYQQMYNKTQTQIIGNPKYLTWDEMWELALVQTKKPNNSAYDKIMNLFTTTDLKGYRQDEKFANLIDDALHCFYGAHCDYFVTIDERCLDKSIKVYQTLEISTKGLKPEDFVLMNISQTGAV